MTQQRNTVMSLVKAFAIILMVMGHAEGPGFITQFIYIFHMPVFFIAAGYFFSRRNVEEPWEFCRKRFRGLYVPMVKWSLLFLLIHNLLFTIGILNEQYGNWEGGVTHPYSLTVALQRVVHIIFSMAGYDEFLLGAFWFFRALLVSSIVFLIMYRLLSKRSWWQGHIPTVAIIIGLTLAFTFVKIYYGLTIVTVVQGGIRECWGVLFFGIGVAFRHYEPRISRSKWLIPAYFAILCVAAHFKCHGMNLKPVPIDVLTLPITGTIGFLMLHNIASLVDRLSGRVKQALVWTGDNTVAVYVWHISAFKVVSAIKIWYYDLDWGQIGCHMVVHEHAATDGFFILYTIVGVGLPLLWLAGYRKIRNFALSKFNR